MKTLFDNIKTDAKIITNDNKLKIRAKQNKPLSKNQQTFNRLTARIENLQKNIMTETSRLENLLKLYTEKVPELKRTLAEHQFNLAMVIGTSTEKMKYSKTQIENIRSVILDLCDQAFEEEQPNKEAEAFYDKWSEISYQEELQNQTTEMKQMFAETLKFHTGIDIDFTDFDDSPEGFARIEARMKEEYEKRCQQQEDVFSKRKKTKKQLESEEMQKQQDSLKLKSLRSIYLSLAKVLHPDMETDPQQKIHKEELMKKVTVAYDNKDLPALLTLEMEWVISENNHLESLSDEKIKLYLAMLKEQVTELETEYYSLKMHPRYADIASLIHVPDNRVAKHIKGMISNYKESIHSIQNNIRLFSKPNSKKEIVEFVNEYAEILDEEFLTFEDIWDD